MLDNRQTRRVLRRRRAYDSLRVPGPQHIFVVSLAFLAVLIQALVVQTHIHIPQPTGPVQTVSLPSLAHGAAIVASSEKSSAQLGRDKYPINEDPSNCPLCQEYSHSGQFLHSAAQIAVLPVTVNVSTVVLVEFLPSRPVVSHSWRGRAPPQV